MCIHLWQAPRQNSILNEWTIHFCQWVWLCAINSERQQNFPVLHVRCSTTSNQASRRLFYQQSDGVIREKHWVIMLDWCSFLLVNMFNIRLTLNTCVIYATQRTLPVPVGILKHLKIQSTEFVKSQRKKLFFFFREQFTLKLAYMYITPETFFLSKTIKNSSYLSFIIIPTKPKHIKSSAITWQ